MREIAGVGGSVKVKQHFDIFPWARERGVELVDGRDLVRGEGIRLIVAFSAIGGRAGGAENPAKFFESLRGLCGANSTEARDDLGVVVGGGVADVLPGAAVLDLPVVDRSGVIVALGIGQSVDSLLVY